MWPRLAELAIAGWLIASPKIFGHLDQPLMRNSDWACAAVIAACALGSISSRSLRRLHLAQLGVAAWLVGFGFFAHPEALPALQNNIMTGFVLALFAIVPSPANEPPLAWQEFEKNSPASDLAS